MDKHSPLFVLQVDNVWMNFLRLFKRPLFTPTLLVDNSKMHSCLGFPSLLALLSNPLLLLSGVIYWPQLLISKEWGLSQKIKMLLTSMVGKGQNDMTYVNRISTMFQALFKELCIINICKPPSNIMRQALTLFLLCTKERHRESILSNIAQRSSASRAHKASHNLSS